MVEDVWKNCIYAVRAESAGGAEAKIRGRIDMAVEYDAYLERCRACDAFGLIPDPRPYWTYKEFVDRYRIEVMAEFVMEQEVIPLQQVWRKLYDQTPCC
jgi:hypothetical protein